MKLIYFYLGSCSNIKFDLEINFSETKKISLINKNELKIVDLKEKFINSFYGENILNISAIVGKNGTGKSTILNLLGLRRLDLLEHYSDSEWIAIYEHNEKYFLEGMNAHKIITNFQFNHKKFIAYAINRADEKLTIMDHIQNHNMIQDKFIITHKPSIENKLRTNQSTNDDRNYGFKRNYIKLNAANFYRFITTTNREFFSNLEHKFISITTSNIKTSDSDPQIKFYQEFNKYSDANFFTRKKRKISVPSQLFFIDLLENYIIYIIKYIFNKNQLTSYVSIINKHVYIDDLLDFNKIKNHLAMLIDKIKDNLRRNNDELISYLDNIEWDYILSFLTSPHANITINRRSVSAVYSCHLNLNVFEGAVLDFISKVTSMNLPLKLIQPDMSSGERDLIEKLAGINSSIELSLSENNNTEGFIIILDEYDEHLHPEWSRCFLDQLISFLTKEYSRYHFQVILSSHSPYIISDLARQNIIKIDYDNISKTFSSSKSKFGFASNLYDIISDSFFLTQPIGAFAVKKIDSMIKDINAISPHDDIDNYNNLANMIAMIDDSFIMKNLMKNLTKKFDYDKKQQIEDIDKQIKDLENRKKKILGELL